MWTHRRSIAPTPAARTASEQRLGRPAFGAGLALLLATTPALAAGFIKDGSVMVSTGIWEVSWQGAAGRPPERFLVLRLTALEREGGGLFGLRRSPSMPGWLPDAHLLTGEVVSGTDPGRRMRLRVPGSELAGATPGGLLAVGLVDATHAICLLQPPAGMSAEAIPDWAKGQPCG